MNILQSVRDLHAGPLGQKHILHINNQLDLVEDFFFDFRSIGLRAVYLVLGIVPDILVYGLDEYHVHGDGHGSITSL